MITRWQQKWGSEVTSGELVAFLVVLVLLLRFAA
jgi:hypothetical protein